eukprot:CAMPEP_0171377456 /NCGR_PEP_ID=MMETSP0879-20121228/21164_1 /TAXON_ID=67004 /ORGANISM="Thalassiosira weissflogii, Strain CCMP1336" /LENGTH=643 /DNA_ID=CAMNT_0011887589 /DNA_START=136 /DNA_END=2063 /DNA_ORIENTATION=-
MSYQFSTTTKHSDETHLESFVESILSASLPNEIRRNLEHLRDLDEASKEMMERWRDVQDECLRGVQHVLGVWGEKAIMEEKEEENLSEDEGDGQKSDDDKDVDSHRAGIGEKHSRVKGKKRKRVLEVKAADASKNSNTCEEMPMKDEQVADELVQTPKKAKTYVDEKIMDDIVGDEGGGDEKAAGDSNEKLSHDESKEGQSTIKVESLTTATTAMTTNNENGTEISNEEISEDTTLNQFATANTRQSDNATKSNRHRRKYIPTTEELLAALLNPSFQPPTNQDNKKTQNYYTQKLEIHTLHRKLRQFSSEKIKTAHQLQNMVDMALGRLNRDLEKFEKELGLIPSSVAAAAAAAGASTNALAAASSASGVAASSALGPLSNAVFGSDGIVSAGRFPGASEPNASFTGAGAPSATSTLISTAPTSTSAAVSSNSSRRASIGAAATATRPSPAATSHSYSRSYSSSHATGILQPPQPILKQSPSFTSTTPSSSSAAAAAYYPIVPNPPMIPTRIGPISSLPLSQQLPPSQQHLHHLHPPPPLPPPVTKNTTTKNLAAIQVVPNTPDWILAKIQSYDKSTKIYTLLDEDVESDNVYTLPEKQVVVLKNTEKTRWARGDEVYAVYPETTSFYHATVSQGARRLGSVG